MTYNQSAMQYGLGRMGIAFTAIGGVEFLIGTLIDQGIVLQAQGAVFFVLGLISLISSR